jgi:non-canonical poly(A) RNA polymerase PAPD5/7
VVIGAPSTDPIHELARVLRDQESSPKLTLITRARVPLIKMVDKATKCPIDIRYADCSSRVESSRVELMTDHLVDACSFNVPNGPENTKLVRHFLSMYQQIRPLALVIKFFLAQRQLNEVYTGGIGSYAILLLLISLLQVCLIAIRIQHTHKHTLIWAGRL